MPHPVNEEPAWAVIPNTHPIQYTRPLLGSELVHDVAHRLNDDLGEVCMGVSFETAISSDVICTRTMDGIGRLRFMAPIIACSIVSDPDDAMKRSWSYTPPSDLSSWISESLSIRTNIDVETFIAEMNARRLPYVHTNGHEQQVRFYLLIGSSEQHSLFMHGSHCIMDARPVLRGFDLLLRWIAQPSRDPISSLPWGTEWRNLPAGPMTATGGPRSDWDTRGVSLMQETNEIRSSAVPSLALIPPPSREFVSVPGVTLRVHETFDLGVSTQIVQAVKALGYSMSHLADAALALVVFDSNPNHAGVNGAHFTLDPTLISQEKFLVSPHTGQSHFIAGLCTVPLRVPYSADLIQGSRRDRLLAIMDVVKTQYTRYVGEPNLPHLISAQLALHPIREALVFPCTPLTSNIGRVETFLDSKYEASQSSSEKPDIDVLALSVGHRLPWKRPLYHLWSLKSQIHLQIQASDAWDKSVIERQLTQFRDNILSIVKNEATTSSSDAPPVATMLPSMMHYASEDFTPTIHHSSYAAIDPLKFDMTGKVIFISGASKGIGRAAAISFARAGAAGIVIAARSENLLTTVAKELEQIDRSHLGQSPVVVMKATMDICLRDSIEAVAARTQALFGRVDVLLNIAGVSDRPQGIYESDPDDWTYALTTNLRGTYIVIKAILPLMIQAGPQSNRLIVNLVSAAIHMPTYRSTAYTLSKLALLRMSEMLHLQYGDTPHNILVVGFHPGFVPTDLTRSVLPESMHHILVDSAELAADSLVWLANEPRPWLGGRYFCCNWDVTELEAMQNEILAGDKLKFRMVL